MTLPFSFLGRYRTSEIPKNSFWGFLYIVIQPSFSQKGKNLFPKPFPTVSRNLKDVLRISFSHSSHKSLFLRLLYSFPGNKKTPKQRVTSVSRSYFVFIHSPVSKSFLPFSAKEGCRGIFELIPTLLCKV